MEKVVLTTIPKQYITPETKYHINPCGNFVIGGPMGDAGLTGRKIIVDTYGGWGAHGGATYNLYGTDMSSRQAHCILGSINSLFRWCLLWEGLHQG